MLEKCWHIDNGSQFVKDLPRESLAMSCKNCSHRLNKLFFFREGNGVACLSIPMTWEDLNNEILLISLRSYRKDLRGK